MDDNKKEWLLKFLCFNGPASEEAFAGAHLQHYGRWRPSDQGADEVGSIGLHVKYQQSAVSFLTSQD